MHDFDVVVVPHPEFADDFIARWVNEHPGCQYHSDVSFVQSYSDAGSLFGNTPSLVIFVDSIVSNDFQKLAKLKNSDILLVVSQKLKFATTKYDHVEFHNVDVSNARIRDHISKWYGLDSQALLYVMKSSDKAISRLALARQISLLSDFDNEMGKYIIDPFLSPETAPWRLFDAILEGRHSDVIQELEVLLFNNNGDAMKIMFPLIGYMKNIMISLDADNKVIDSKKSSYFRGKARGIVDKVGFMRDIEDMSTTMLKTTRSDSAVLFKSYVYSMSTRCKRR